MKLWNLWATRQRVPVSFTWLEKPKECRILVNLVSTHSWFVAIMLESDVVLYFVSTLSWFVTTVYCFPKPKTVTLECVSPLSRITAISGIDWSLVCYQQFTLVLCEHILMGQARFSWFKLIAFNLVPSCSFGRHLLIVPLFEGRHTQFRAFQFCYFRNAYQNYRVMFAFHFSDREAIFHSYTQGLNHYWAARRVAEHSCLATLGSRYAPHCGWWCNPSANSFRKEFERASIQLLFCLKRVQVCIQNLLTSHKLTYTGCLKLIESAGIRVQFRI